jgi:hypothetical protein
MNAAAMPTIARRWRNAAAARATRRQRVRIDPPRIDAGAGRLVRPLAGEEAVTVRHERCRIVDVTNPQAQVIPGPARDAPHVVSMVMPSAFALVALSRKTRADAARDSLLALRLLTLARLSMRGHHCPSGDIRSYADRGRLRGVSTGKGQRLPVVTW